MENKKKRRGSLINSTKDSIDPHHYHEVKWDEKAFTKFGLEKIRSCHEVDDDDTWKAQRVLDEKYDEHEEVHRPD